jgi:hypothetical protein
VQLRLTRRALADLGLDTLALARRPAGDYADRHEVVRKFVELRSQSPVGQESTQLPATKAPVFNLHCGRWRGLTWHDEEAGVVWLLGAGWHETGSIDDAYERLKRRDRDESLMPTLEDYLDLEATWEENRDFSYQVSQEAPALLAQARSHFDVEVHALIAERLELAVLIHREAVEDGCLEEIAVGFSLPPRDGTVRLPPQAEWILIVMAALVEPPITSDDLDYGQPFPRGGGSRANEVVVCWCGPCHF